eukprot:GHVR01030408.1.p1 GENE.GHVR01030408.1~~GHVR01030408.1.p1  ORF type:complete len:270 (-),score=77.76 GHVR01030408.1:136-921(-)
MKFSVVVLISVYVTNGTVIGDIRDRYSSDGGGGSQRNINNNRNNNIINNNNNNDMFGNIIDNDIIKNISDKVTDSMNTIGTTVGNMLDGNILDGNMLDGNILDGNMLDGNILDGNILNGNILDGSVFDLADRREDSSRDGRRNSLLSRVIEPQRDWTGWYDMDVFCIGQCPLNSECESATIVQSGQMCRCKQGTEYMTNIFGKKECTTWEGFHNRSVFCRDGDCPRRSYCLRSIIHGEMCTCLPEYVVQIERDGDYDCEKP